MAIGLVRCRMGRRGCRMLPRRLTGRHLIFDLIEQGHEFVSQAFPFGPVGPAKGGLRLIPVVMWIRSRHNAFRQAPDGASTAPLPAMESPSLTFDSLW